MCFSAPVSFTASAVLIPAGIVALQQARKLATPYTALALLPLVFGIQQLFEGWLWLLLGQGGTPDYQLPVMGFLFFSHFFWLFWVPWACYRLEPVGWRRRLFLGISILGFLYGLAMYLPLWWRPDWIGINIIGHSISYEIGLFFEELLPRLAVRGLYALLVLIPLLLSSRVEVRYFGILILLSVIISAVVFRETFISVWCLFAALLSLYMLYMLRQAGNAREA